MIPDRIIEQGTLTTDGSKATVEVRLPWYRALPGSSISEVGFAIDGVPAQAESLRWTMNGRTFRLDELATELDEWWFPTDSAVVSADLPVEPGEGEHQVDVELKLYIPYIVTDQGVLRIEEHDTKTMKAAKK
ncbi:C-glycoside deglycosidase beta subunit domain-containing protein [Naasia aerilata]|uniref:C-deglycosylation enzyme beta subunit n=1 Tax=Naasia aerilata TaxID=1162966 RepID=A0ABN6XHR6_9MICO|nr:DUF6379 domain-containing protein [Naasia aerilata]BDZ44458.1 hypothetical protein GCM10025866_03670 [Naasia aerilata]